uniref:Uncharacterized protein n=1 Tax=Anguilla anguilla TaxID=7936 RepID=A0A0E9PGT8_ANGAN
MNCVESALSAADVLLKSLLLLFCSQMFNLLSSPCSSPVLHSPLQKRQ